VLGDGGVLLGEAPTARELAAGKETALVGMTADVLSLPPAEITVSTDSPQGAGLGGSSALVIAVIAAAEALVGHAPSPASARAALARDIEARLMSLPTGTQDHYPALLGGALVVGHEPGGERIEPLAVDLTALGESLVVAYTGRSHFSAGANWTVVRRRLEGDPKIRELFAGIARVAVEMAEALARGDLPRAGRLMSEEWSLRRQLSPEISTPTIEALLARGRARGGWGGKACGAGGGGSVALLVAPESREEVVRTLSDAGAQVLRVQPAAGGVDVAVEA